MIFIQHRVLSANQLSNISIDSGIEVDVRTGKNFQLIIAHEPFQDGELFEDFLKEFKKKNFQGPLIINTKEDLLEESIFELLSNHKVDHFLFLDSHLPTLVRHLKSPKAQHFMVRASQYETVGEIWQGLEFQWIWLDCFDGKPLPLSQVQNLSQNYKICLVSPELQGADLLSTKSKFQPLLPYCSAICTKHPELWTSP